MDYAVEIEDLVFRHKDGTQALRGVNLKIKKGSKTAILGPNGAGKSTLLLHLNGIYLPQCGRVKVIGLEANRENEKKIRQVVGLVFQDPDDQVFCTTVWEDVAFGPMNFNLPEDEVQRRVKQALKAVSLEGLEQKMPFHLSCGQRKRVAIAGVLALKPEILVLDEPDAFLDPSGKTGLMQILKVINDDGGTVIAATHDVNFAYEWADDVVIIKDGRVLAQGGPEILADEKVINESELEYPVLVKLFREMPEIGYDSIPRTVEGAAKLIKQKLLHAES